MPKSQSNESDIITRLMASENAPATFVEFGFHPGELNCADLAFSAEGLLIDGGTTGVEEARAIFPPTVECVTAWLTLNNLDMVRNKFARLGLLSIDVDGNDYWLLEALLHVSPSVVAVEYNATFGLRPLTVPYDPHFDRHEKHASGWYHGASITALSSLSARHGYGLAEVSDSGVNLFFTRSGNLDPAVAWRPNTLRGQWSGKGVDEQWDTISHLPFVTV